MGIGLVVTCLGKEIYSDCYNAGLGTVNIGEWTGLIEALDYARRVQNKYDKITIVGDSQLVIRQINGEYQVKKDRLKPLQSKALLILGTLPIGKVSFVWNRRELNKRADELSKLGLEKEHEESWWTSLKILEMAEILRNNKILRL